MSDLDDIHMSPHLQPAVWQAVNRELVRKIIAELAHERLLQPEPLEEAPAPEPLRYVLRVPSSAVRYELRATRMALDHWVVDAPSISKLSGADAEELPLDALELLLELQPLLQVPEDLFPLYLEEVSSTLSRMAYRWIHQRDAAPELAVGGSFQAIESAMTAGHPCFIANGGRIGFDARDHAAYGPESARPLRVVWLAARRSRARFESIEHSHAQWLESELGAEAVARFEDSLRSQGFDPAHFVWLPVHPWQWRHKIQHAFARELATGELVLLGESEDRYVAQQSLRTLFNLDAPWRCYVKSALSVLNMGFMRGLSPDYMQDTPAINAWVDDLVRRDPFLQSRGFGILRELASVGFRSPIYETGAPPRSAHRKMLASLWRESPVCRLQPGQRLMTGAALLHRDRDGSSLLAALIASAGAGPEAWLRDYLEAYLAPLLHCFYAHDLVFMPHGENTLLVLQEGRVVRVLLKDIGEEVAVIDPGASLPAAVERIRVEVPEAQRTLALFTDVFDCFFRFLAEILQVDCGLPERRFWLLVGECIERYQAAHPSLAERFARFDLFAPRFALSCLNRLQLANTRQLLDLSDPSKALRFAGTLENPLARLRAPAVSPTWRSGPTHSTLEP